MYNTCIRVIHTYIHTYLQYTRYKICYIANVLSIDSSRTTAKLWHGEMLGVMHATVCGLIRQKNGKVHVLDAMRAILPSTANGDTESFTIDKLICALR